RDHNFSGEPKMASNQFRVVRVGATNGACACPTCASGPTTGASGRRDVPDPPSLDEAIRKDRGLPAAPSVAYPIDPATHARSTGTMPVPVPDDFSDRKEQR